MGKRSFALLLALVLTATLFSACTKGTTGQTETTAKPPAMNLQTAPPSK